MCACRTRAVSLASVRKRARAPGASARFGLSTLSATRFPVSGRAPS